MFQADHDIAAWRCHWCGYPISFHMLGDSMSVDGVATIRLDVERFEREVSIHQRYCSYSPVIFDE